MDLGMSYDEVKLAMRIISLRKGSMKAVRKHRRYRFHKDRDTLMGLQEKGHVQGVGNESTWMLTSQGIQQLKQQIGEFHF